MKRYTNTPGSRSTFGVNDYEKKKPAEKLSPYQVTGGNWTAEERAAFNAPVSKPPPGRRVVARPFISPRQKQQAAGNDLLSMALKKIMKKPNFTAPGFTGKEAQARIHTQQVRRDREIRNLLSSLAQAQMGNQNRLAVTKEQGRGRLASERLAGENRMAAQKLANQGRLQGISAELAGQERLKQLAGMNQLELARERANLALQAARESDQRSLGLERFKAATRLLERGATGQGLTQLANAPGWASVDLSNIEMPSNEQPEKPKRIYVKPQFNAKGEMLPGTGQWVTEPTGGGGLNADLSPDDEKELTDLYNSGNLNDFYARIIQIMQGQ